MTTEAVLLLGLFAFLLLGVFVGETGPKSVFAKSGPRLGARIESHISTGQDFLTPFGAKNQWSRPEGNVGGSSF